MWDPIDFAATGYECLTEGCSAWDVGLTALPAATPLWKGVGKAVGKVGGEVLQFCDSTVARLLGRHLDEGIEAVGDIRLLPSGTVIEFGSGSRFTNLENILEMYPGASVIMTEQSEWGMYMEHILELKRQGKQLPPDLAQLANRYEDAIEKGVQFRFDDYHLLSGEGTQAATSIAVAPQPGFDPWTGKPLGAIKTAETMADVTLPGGTIYIVAAEKNTALAMAETLSGRYSIPVGIETLPREKVPYLSDFLGDEVYVIDLQVPTN
jgi:hypothetical protein